MWTEKQMNEYLKAKLKKSRYVHSLGVMDTAVKLAERHGADVAKARIAGLIHDCAKCMDEKDMIDLVTHEDMNIDEVSMRNAALLHGPAGAIIAENEMGIGDQDILGAVRYHTTGKSDMSLLEKIVYIADYIEPNRNFPGVEELREITFEDLDKGLLKAFDNTIKHVVDGGQLLHFDTVKGRNYLLCRK